MSFRLIVRFCRYEKQWRPLLFLRLHRVKSVMRTVIDIMKRQLAITTMPKKIMASLAAINPDFYPIPLVPAIRQPDGSWHFGRKTTGYMTRKRFENFYDRLGKYLHTINPWGKDPQLHQLCNDLPAAIDAVYELLDLHFAVIHIEEPASTQIWVVDAKRDGTVAMTIAMADGRCVIHPS